MSTYFLKKALFITAISTLIFFGVTRAQTPDTLNTENPFQVSVTYFGDFAANVTGGNDTGFRYLDNIDVNIQADLGAFLPQLEGTTVYLYGLGNQGGSISELAGDSQGVSNIEAENSWRFYEIWAQKKFLYSGSSILFGLYDINSEFNYLESSQLFMNSSHGIDPTIALSGELGPSIFPYTSLGTRIKVNPYEGLIIQAAVLDGVPSDPGNTRGTKVRFDDDDGLFLITEVGLYSTEGRDMLMRSKLSRIDTFIDRNNASDNSISVGGWLYTSKRQERPPNSGESLEYGLYALGEYKLAENHNVLLPIHTFARVGFSNEIVSEVSGFFGMGFTIEGLFPNREQDYTGFAIAHAAFSPDYLTYLQITDAPPTTKSETNFELTHSFRFNKYLQLQVNSQYIVNPGLLERTDDALVLALRGIIGF